MNKPELTMIFGTRYLCLKLLGNCDYPPKENQVNIENGILKGITGHQGWPIDRSEPITNLEPKDYLGEEQFRDMDSRFEAIEVHMT